MAATDLFTLEDLATEVAQNYGDTSDITIAKAKKWINRALLRINEMGDWSWLMTFDATFSTVSGTESYTLADGVKRVYSLFIQDTSRRVLRLMDDRTFREMNTSAVNPQGTPYSYRLYGRNSTNGRRKVALWPVPNAVFTMYYDYRKDISLLSADTDDVRITCGMPAHMVDALIELASAIGYRELDDSDYESAMAEAVVRWQNLLADDLTEIDDRIRQRSFDDDFLPLGDPMLPPQFGV